MNTHAYINILIVEPSSIIYEGLNRILSGGGLRLRVYRAENFDAIEQCILSKKINVAIVNPLYVQNNEKGFHSLRSGYPATSWVALVYAFFDQRLLSLFDGSISISDSPESVIQLVRQNASTENKETATEEVLSERETDVLKLLATGLTNKEIAEKLSISINTVITHRKNITQKTGIKSVSGLTIYAVVKKLVSLDYLSE
ncbi:response regulator transcription factor [Prolixibacter denitrificans]|uniref:DNA-binding NarL/FixJ family response regulator n=1 Tax=Prolixibacter denitrificans TaxID=1541063 RepID=A0A2P8CKN7_9BACT|nr:response regulator transcription factor [Prolixibacter denitrificans]PSK85529.1 DNA-binding NarL/FixJ family response regulator [Prolixibacter denitrificans]GET20150.1 helix-turn-helix transcriptional regulator [Prolixibacter denitrificans]